MKSNNIRDSPPPLRDYQQVDLAKMQNYEGRAALMVLATGLEKHVSTPSTSVGMCSITTTTA